MKYLIINGSPHKGNTYNAAISFKSLLEKSDNEAVFDEVHLKNIEIPFCLGCNNCFFKGEQNCPHKNVAVVADKIKESDFIIVISPVYSLSLSALLKNFIDHMSYNYHRPSYFSKKALVISSTVGAGAHGVTKYVRDVLKFWGFNKVHKFAFRSTDLDAKTLPDSVTKKIKKLGRKITSDLNGGKLEKPSLKRILFFNAWRAISTIGEYETSADKRYWTDNQMANDLFDKRITIGLPKKLFAKLSYSIFKKII